MTSWEEIYRQLEKTVSINYNGIRLEPGRDYDMTFRVNEQETELTMTWTGKGNYCGTRDGVFKIEKSDNTIRLIPQTEGLLDGEELCFTRTKQRIGFNR